MKLLWKVVAIKAIDLDQSKQLILILINQSNRSCVPKINFEVVEIKAINFDQSYANFDNVKSEAAKNISLLLPSTLFKSHCFFKFHFGCDYPIVSSNLISVVIIPLFLQS